MRAWPARRRAHAQAQEERTDHTVVSTDGGPNILRVSVVRNRLISRSGCVMKRLVELSATGILTLHVSPLDKRSIDLSDSNATVTLPKVSKRPFCLQVTQSKLNQCVLDASTGLQFEKWRQALCRFASLEGNPFQLYTFSISLCGEQMGENMLVIRFSHFGGENYERSVVLFKTGPSVWEGFDSAARSVKIERIESMVWCHSHNCWHTVESDIGGIVVPRLE